MQRFQLRLAGRFRAGQRRFEEQIEQHLIGRLERLVAVRRFVFGWLVLVILLIGALVVQNLALGGYYQTSKPVPGGTYNEGVLGQFTNANPLYAVSDADTTVSKLLFAGLLTINDQGRLVGNLAASYSADSRGNTYTVHLRPHLTWQDGQPLTSRDVLFTYNEIKNPDAQSPLQNSWQNIEVSAPDAQTVKFSLPDASASFPYSLTNGIVPEHLLAKIPPSDLRSADFNTVHPVGAGPFAWQAIQVSGNGDPDKVHAQIALVPFGGYHAGRPKLQKFVVQTYASQNTLVEAFHGGQLNGLEGLNALPNELKNNDAVVQHNLLLRAANMVFFKTTNSVLSDVQVRRALVQGANVPQIMQQLGYATRAVREPILSDQLGYDPSLAQASFNLKAARHVLDNAGWISGKDGMRSKDGKPLTFTLTASATPENRLVASLLQKQWKAIGVRANVQLQNNSDFQSTLTDHGYEAVLNGISIGVDPDVFVYWDSSQADIRSGNRLNLSEYKNPVADDALEAGRTRLDPQLRVIKYRPFLQAWQQDAPALGLYQPRVLYLTNGAVNGLDDSAVNAPTDRLNNVQNWEIRQAKVTN